MIIVFKGHRILGWAEFCLITGSFRCSKVQSCNVDVIILGFCVPLSWSPQWSQTLYRILDRLFYPGSHLMSINCEPQQNHVFPSEDDHQLYHSCSCVGLSSHNHETREVGDWLYSFGMNIFLPLLKFWVSASHTCLEIKEMTSHKGVKASITIQLWHYRLWKDYCSFGCLSNVKHTIICCIVNVIRD